jgi:hypothetical protein
MKIRMILFVLISSGSAVAMMGCASASNATDSTFSYIRGDQRATLGATPPVLAGATVQAAAELSLPVHSQYADGLVGKVVMYTSDNTKVEVNIKGEDNDKSEVTVRVGTFGDKALQQRVLEKIESHLTGTAIVPAGAPAAVARAGAQPMPAPAPTPVAAPAPRPVAARPAPSAVAAPPAPVAAPVAAPTPAPANPPVNPLSPGAAPATPPGF